MQIESSPLRVALIVFILLSCAISHAAFSILVILAHLYDRSYLIMPLRISSTGVFAYALVMLFVLEGRRPSNRIWLWLIFLSGLVSVLLVCLKGLAFAVLSVIVRPELMLVNTIFPPLDVLWYFLWISILLLFARGCWKMALQGFPWKGRWGQREGGVTSRHSTNSAPERRATRQPGASDVTAQSRSTSNTAPEQSQ